MVRLRAYGPLHMRLHMRRRAGVTTAAAALFLGLALSSGNPSQAATWGQWGQYRNESGPECLTAFDNDVVNMAPCETGRATQMWSPEIISPSEYLIRNAAGGCLWARPIAGFVGAYRGDCNTNDAAKRFVFDSFGGIGAASGTGRMVETQAWGNRVLAFSTTATDPSSVWWFHTTTP